MSQPSQIQDDLHFVRQVVAKHDRISPYPAAFFFIWAIYVLVGYCLLDINVHWANWFFLLASIPAGAASGYARQSWVRQNGEFQNEASRKARLHFFIGGLLAVAAVIGLACCAPGFRGPVTGQVSVILFGMIYFLAGVHFDRSFLWLGPLLIVGGVVVGLIPHYGWSALGVVIALGLCVAGIHSKRQQSALAGAE